MAAIGYEKAKNLMEKQDWKMRVTMDGEALLRVELYHPNRPNIFPMRKDSYKKLYPECRVIGTAGEDYRTAVLCYDHDGSNEELI